MAEKDKQAPLGTLVQRLERVGGRLTAGALTLLVAGGIGGVALGHANASSRFHSMAAPARPMRLVVPSLHIRARVVPIVVGADATLTPPANYREVGWWKASAKPGSPTGQTVVTGHTVHTGGGQMDHLGSIRPGAVVKVVTRHGTMWYREQRVVTYSKAQLTRNARALFAQGRPSNRLVLITCSGWTGTSYTSNVVAFAKPLGVPDKSAKKKHSHQH